MDSEEHSGTFLGCRHAEECLLGERGVVEGGEKQREVGEVVTQSRETKSKLGRLERGEPEDGYTSLAMQRSLRVVYSLHFLHSTPHSAMETEKPTYYDHLHLVTQSPSLIFTCSQFRTMGHNERR